MSERGRLSTQAGVSSSRERAQEKSRQSGVQLSSFSLSFDFFVSSSARVPVNVYDNLPVIAELPKGTVISCVTSFGSEPDYFVHVGTSEVGKEKKKTFFSFFFSFVRELFFFIVCPSARLSRTRTVSSLRWPRR